jgi:predicted dehydrogenase
MTRPYDSKRPLLFAVVGCGRISDKHLGALTSGQLDARLVAVADVDEGKARAAGERHGVPWFRDYHALLAAHPEIDVISVLTPSGLHVDHVVDLAPYGKHVVCEKPMALRPEHCARMIAACKQGGGRLFVVKQNRFNPAVQAARQALEAGRFGRIVSGSVTLRWRRDQSYYDQADWRGTWALDGGVLAQQATHHLDLLQWFLGPVESVQCQTATRLMDIEVEDTAAAVLRFRSGALATFEATTAARPKDICCTLSLLGERGTVVVGGVAVNDIELWQFDHGDDDEASVAARFSQEVTSVYGRGHLPFLSDVIDAIRTGRPAMVEGEEGRRNVEILCALYESAALGGETVRPGQPLRHTRLGLRDGVPAAARA